jgi:hypothetical protein
MLSHKNPTALAIIAFFAAIAAQANASSIFNFTSFDGPGNNGGGTTVNGINSNGYVVGFSSDNAATPTLLTNFTRNPSGTLTILNVNNDPLAMANGINNSNTVVGASNNQAFEQTGSVFLPLPMVNGTTASETAAGINDAGLIVGQFTDGATDTSPGFIYNGSALRS